MHNSIIRDLTKNKAREIQAIRDIGKFDTNAGWAGYFFDGAEADKLASIATHENTPRHGLNVPIWDRNNNSLNAYDFVKMVMETRPDNVAIVGYSDNGTNQAVKVTSPNIYMSAVTPHITISYSEGANIAASGYMQFGVADKHLSLPPVLHDGQIKFIMQNNREMDLTWFRMQIRELEKQRIAEISQKVPEAVRVPIEKAVHDAIDNGTAFSVMTWDQLKSQFISNGLEFNESMATLYAQYIVDTTDSKMPTRSQVEAKEEEEEAMYDKMTDEQHDEDEQGGNDLECLC